MRNRYNQTFKDEAIALVLDHDESIAKIAVDLGVHPHTLGNWGMQGHGQTEIDTSHQAHKARLSGIRKS